MKQSVLHTIRASMDGFSKGQKRIADYILNNYDKAAFMTAAKLGQTAQVSESTVIPLCRRHCRRSSAAS